MQLYAERTQYLGLIITKDGIMADPNKVKVIRQVLPPTCVREVKSFIGVCSYYTRFIPNFSTIVKPFIILTKKFAKFEWNKECQTALVKLHSQTSPQLKKSLLLSFMLYRN